MKHSIVKIEIALVLVGVVLAAGACSSGGGPSNTAATNAAAKDTKPETNTAAGGSFSENELDELMARIALYPDPIIAQMIPAATFIDQLKEAQATLKGSSDDAKIGDQNWDVSVKSIAHYPDLLKTMVENEDWTTSLGQAYVQQPADVAKSIQRLRSEAADVGNLVTTPQQEVVQTGEVITIVPAEPKTIYIPQYDPETVYVEPPLEQPVEQQAATTEPLPQSSGNDGAIARRALAFGAGLLIGSWLNNDYDYNGRGVYYHGWSGSGWVGANRAYVDVNRSVYVNNSYSNINVNRSVVNRNTSAYRSNLALNGGLRRERVNTAQRNRVNPNNARQRNELGRDLDRNNLDRNQPGLDRDRNPGDLDRGRNPGGIDRNNAGRDDRPAGPQINGGSRNPPNSGRNPGGGRAQTQPVQRQQPSKPAQRQAPSGSSRGGRRN